MARCPAALLRAPILLALIATACSLLPTAPPPVPAPTEATRAPTAPPAAPAATSRSATVSEIVNLVEARPSPAEAFNQVSDGYRLRVGGQLQTLEAARARLDFSEGTIVRLGPNTAFTMEALTEAGGGPITFLKLQFGKMWASLSGGTLQVGTPVGVASVRGSFAAFEFDPGDPSDPNDDILIVDCIEGTCAVHNQAIDERAGNLERLIVTEGGQGVIRLTLTGEDVQAFIQNNPEVAAAIAATLTAAAPPAAATATEAEQEQEQETATPPPPEAPTPTDTSSPVPAPPIIGRHVLLDGETLFCIGRAYGVRPDAIAQANGLPLNATVFFGQPLAIPAVRWVNIPPGPVCPPQFRSPYPGLPVSTPTPAATDTPLASETPRVAATDTATPTPPCKPPEFYDPFLNRCRLPDPTPYGSLSPDSSPLYLALARVRQAMPVGSVSSLLTVAGVLVVGWAYGRRRLS